MRHCARCKVNALKEQLLAQYPDGNIPPSKAQPLYARCIICSHGCTGGRTPCETYTRRTQLEKEIPALAQEVARLKGDAHRRPDLYGYVYGQKRDALAAAKDAFDACRRTCLSCNRTSDDARPHDGISFVSLDASGGRSRDDNPDLEDWLSAQSVRDVNDPTVTPGGFRPVRVRASGITNLPPAAEDALRKELANFSGRASLVDKILAAVLLTPNPRAKTNVCYNLSDFGKLRWIFDEDRAHKRHETEVSRFLRACGWIPRTDLRGQSAARLGISKQAVSVRFKNLVRKVPFLAAVAARTLRPDDAADAAADETPARAADPARTAPRPRPRTERRICRFLQPGLLDDSFAVPVPERTCRRLHPHSDTKGKRP